jgi:hypothetical protein
MRVRDDYDEPRRLLRPRRILGLIMLVSLCCGVYLKVSGGTLAVVHTQNVVSAPGQKITLSGTRIVLAFGSHPVAAPMISYHPGQQVNITPQQAKRCPLPKTLDVVTGLYAGKIVKNLVVGNDCYYGAWRTVNAHVFGGSVPADSPQALDPVK